MPSPNPEQPEQHPNPPENNNPPQNPEDPDPIINSYSIHLTSTSIPRVVLQYLDRDPKDAYDDAHGQKPTSLRLKPETGLLEVDVPINTRVNYDVPKGLRYGDALRKSKASHAGGGGGFGMAGGFATGGGGSGAAGPAGAKVKSEPQAQAGVEDKSESAANSLLRVQTLGGRIKEPEEGDPVYMLATFRDDNLFLSPVSSVVQLRPQLHHLDALDEVPKTTRGGGAGGKGRKDDAGEDRPAEPEARAVDVKIKAAASEDSEAALLAGNLDLLKRMQEEKWTGFDWVDAETHEAWDVYDGYMLYEDVDEVPQLQAALDTEDYLDSMSAPRIDPARPEMTGWAMKQNRRRQRTDEEST